MSFCFSRASAVVASWLLLFFTLPCISPAQVKPSASHDALSSAEQKQLQSALDAQEAGHLQDAESVLHTLSVHHPHNFEILESFGLLYVAQSDFTKAIPYLQRASAVSPRSAIASANLGAAYLKAGRQKEAIAALEKSSALDPGNADTQANLGIALMQDGQASRAAKAFAIAANSRPHDADLLYNWAVALLAANQAEKAADVGGRIPGAETSGQVQSLLADAAEHSGKFKEAVEHYEAAAKLDPSEANLYALGMEFVRHWTFEPATKVFEYGLTRYPGSARLLSGQGIALYANNDYAGAAKIFSGLLEKFPDNSTYAEILGHSCNLMPDASEGCETLVDFAVKHPGNASAETYGAAIVLHRTAEAKNLELARTLLEHAIAANPKLPEAYFQLGVLQQQQGKWEESKAALEQCLTLSPHLSRAHYRLGLAYSRLGDKAKARAEFDLQRKYSQEEKDQVNARLEEVTTFLVSGK